MTTVTFTKTAPPPWLLAMWREIDDKTFGKGFDCFAEDAVCNLGVADWHGRETIRNNLRAFIDRGFTALHDVVEYWDGPALKVFRGTVTMTFDDRKLATVKPVMTHFFYMDEADPTKVSAGSDRSARPASSATRLMPLEILHVALVLLGGRARLEGAEIAALAGLRIGLAGIEPVFAGLQFADHGGGPVQMPSLSIAVAGGLFRGGGGDLAMAAATPADHRRHKKTSPGGVAGLVEFAGGET